MKRQYIIIIMALIILLSGCGNQAKNNSETSKKPQNTQETLPSNKSTSVSSPDKFNDSFKMDTAGQLIQLLPEGTINASVLKRTYVYKSAQDEKREKELEEKYRKAIEKNWSEIIKNLGDTGGNTYKNSYNKDVAFRDNYRSIFEYRLNDFMDEKSGISLEEYMELDTLYNSAVEKIVEDFNTSLTISKTAPSQIEITSDNKPKLLKGVKIDFSTKKLNIGNDLFVEVGNEKSDGFPTIEPFLHKANYDGKNIENKYIWYREIDTEHFDIFAISKVDDTKQIVLRYVILELNKNKYTEDMILIKAN